MSKFINTHTIRTLWRVIDSHWVCVSDRHEDRVLCDYLFSFGFDNIPSFITYCVADSSSHRLKFRQSGGLISVYLTPLNYV